MTKLLLIASLTLVLTGCTYTAADEVGPGQFMIHSHGSIFNSREALLDNINQKAAKVCDGKSYHLEGNTGANIVITTASHIGQTPSTVLGLKAICEDR